MSLIAPIAPSANDVDAADVTTYSYSMAKLYKLLEKARTNPSGLSFKEFEALLEAAHWRFRRQTGSHRVWISRGNRSVPIQPRGAKAKAYQVQQVLRILDEEGVHG